MKKLIGILTACALGLSLFSCSKGGEGESTDIKESSADPALITYDDDFFMPIVGDTFEYSAQVTSFNKQQLEAIVELALGSGAYAQGEYDAQAEDIGTYMWQSGDGISDASADINGGFDYTDGNVSQKVEAAADEWNQSGRIYRNKFIYKSVELHGNEYTLAELCDEAEGKLNSLLGAAGSSAQIAPFYARTVSDGEQDILVRFVFTQKLDSGVFSAYSVMFEDAQGFNSPLPAPRLIIDTAGGDDVTDVCTYWALEDIKTIEDITPITGEQALDAAEALLAPARRKARLEYSALEYRTVSKKGDIYTFLPYYAFYGRDNDDKAIAIYVSAETAEADMIEIGED